MQHVFMHEIIHQWAGDRTTIATPLDFVWKEAIAEYLSYVFEDEHGDPAEAAMTRAYWDLISPYSVHYPRPTDEPAPEVVDFYGDVYGPGPMVLFVQLEPLVGRANVLTALKSFLGEPGARTVEDLRGALEQASGADLAAYFDAWVIGSGAPSWPVFTAASSQVGDQVTVTLTQEGAELFGCAVEVAVVGPTSTVTAVVDFGVAPTGAMATQTVTLAEPVQSLVVDPDHRVVEGTPPGVVRARPPKRWIF
jgi:aminopeptidase N